MTNLDGMCSAIGESLWITDDRPKRQTLYTFGIRWRRKPREVCHGAVDIYQFRQSQCVPASTRFSQPWGTNHKWDTAPKLPDVLLRPRSVFTELVAMVAEEHNQCAVSQTKILQCTRHNLTSSG